jgi:cell division GTPase FtsZ
VKSAGRALEIVAVGLGQAGGNLAAELARLGYRALALNTASTDLSTLSARGGLALPDEQRMYIGIDGHDGAGSDVGYGRECITAHATKIRERVGEHAAGADVVLLTCGLGGGTGSSIAALVETLEDLSLPLVVLATLPSTHESGIAKVNAVRAVNDLVKQSLLGWILVDNARLAQGHGTVSLDRYYEEINKVILEPLHALNLLNDRPEITPIRTLDGEDFRTLLLSSGLLNYGVKRVGKLTNETVIDAVRECLQTSLIMPEGFGLENVAYLGIVLEAPEALLKSVPFALFEQIGEQLKDETRGGAVYIGVYKSDNATTEATVRVLCSTQALPEGVQEMVSVARREGAQLREKLQKTLTGLDLGEIEEYELFRTSPGTIRRRVAEAPATSRKGGGGGRASIPPRASTPPAPTSTAVREAVRANAMSFPPPGGAAPADREAYDQMVRDYKASDSEDVKKQVVDRLETDRRSDNSLVRYYAVRAMTKLDPALFADALQAAAQDDDATVRAIATKALQR